MAPSTATVCIKRKAAPIRCAELLGETRSPPSSALEGGRYFTIYLAPHNYHRVHSPLAARLTRTRYIPGARFSVSRATAAAIPRLFCRNERVVCWFETDYGTDGRRVRRRAERLEHQHVRARRDRERPTARLARAATASRCSRRRDRPLQHGLDRRRAARRRTRSSSLPASPTDIEVRMGQALGAFAPT